MKGQGELNKAWRKKYNPDDKGIIVGFKEFVFAHQANEGDTTIDLLNLVKPVGEYWSQFQNPSQTEVMDAKLDIFKNNLRLTRGGGGLMFTGEYNIPNTTVIELATPALAGEIFEGKMSYSPRTTKTITIIPSYQLPTFNIDWTISEVYFKEIFGDAAFTFSNIKDGGHIIVNIRNSDIVRRNVEFPAVVEWANKEDELGVDAGTIKPFLFIRSGAHILGRVLYGSTIDDNISLTAQTYSIPENLEANGGVLSIDCNKGNNFKINLSDPTVFNVVNAKVGGIYSLYINHIGNGNGISWDASLDVKIANGILDIGYVDGTYNIITLSCIDDGVFLVSYSADYY